jgi:hypothetical protein
MNETFDQHDAHSPPLPPTGWRHAAHNGGKAVSSSRPQTARPKYAKPVSRRGVSDGVTDMPVRVASL